MFECLIGVLFPQPSSCAFCGRILKEYSKYSLCPVCLGSVKRNKNAFKTGREFLNVIPGLELSSEGFDAVISPCAYEGNAREMIHRLKYNDKRSLAASMAAFMAEEALSCITGFDIIVSVPSHKKRIRKRGYNQAELIARELSNITGKPFISALERVRDTPSQVLYNGGERWYNVKDAFSCSENMKGLRVLLVDDVITTGATIYYCSAALKASGACYVAAISFARAAD